MKSEQENLPYNNLSKFERIIPGPGQSRKVSCSIEKIAYQEHFDMNNVIWGLSFWLLGHEINNSRRNDFFGYLCVTSVNFSSHFSYIRPAFQIISQLYSLRKVVFTMDSHQKPFFMEIVDSNNKNLSVPPNPGVVTLDVIVDPNLCHLKTLQDILETLFDRAEEVMPNLLNLHLKLPVMNVSREVLLRVVHNGWLNLAPHELSFTVEYFPPTVRIAFV
jgi:hypothetical protein